MKTLILLLFPLFSFCQTFKSKQSQVFENDSTYFVNQPTKLEIKTDSAASYFSVLFDDVGLWSRFRVLDLIRVKNNPADKSSIYFYRAYDITNDERYILSFRYVDVDMESIGVTNSFRTVVFFIFKESFLSPW